MAQCHAQERSLYGKGTLFELTHETVPAIAEVEKYRPGGGAEYRVEQRYSHCFAGGDDRADLRSDATRARQCNTVTIFSDERQMRRAAKETVEQK